MAQKNIFSNKVVLVTGGCGSIGSVLVEKLIRNHKPKQVRIFEQSESALFEATRKYYGNSRLRFFLGDVRDKERVMSALKGAQVVFHTAALKHVSLNEYSPFESVKTNVIGTQNILEAALANKVERLVNISSDKAANPTSTMGASKLLAERLTVGADYFKGKAKTVFCSVRFGNVLNSSGSVVPIFMEQIKKGGPITITDKRMVRYFMTIEQAVELIFKAAQQAQGGEVFILKMPALKVVDLAEVLVEKFAKGKIAVKEIGKRAGEKIYEKIVTSTEADQALELDKMYVLPLSISYPGEGEKTIKKSYNYYKSLGGKPVPEEGVKPEKLLNKQEIKRLIEKLKL